MARRNLPPWVMPALLYGGGAFLIYKLARGIFDKAGAGVDAATSALAKAIVGDSQIKPAAGITYQMPNGSRIPAEYVQPAGGAYVSYLGVRYRIVAASPPGSGNYAVVRA